MRKIVFTVLVPIICCAFFTGCGDEQYYNKKDGTVTVVTRGEDMFGNKTTTSQNITQDAAAMRKIGRGILQLLFSSGK